MDHIAALCPSKAVSVTKSHRSLVIAWQGLPFYACRCFSQFRRTHPTVKLHVVTSGSPLDRVAAEHECGGAVQVIDSEESLRFEDLNLTVPDHLFVTSWSHPAYQNLAREAKARGAGVTVMIDNCLHRSVRQWAGAFYFRMRLRPLFDDAWVPGRAGQAFARFIGMPRGRVQTGLYAADETIFFPPAEDARREGMVFVGQFIERKAVRELWEAVRGRRDPLVFSMIGEGPLKAELAVSGAPVGPGLRPEEIAVYLRSISALILPSRLDHWGLVLHEAALSGCILLATTTCGAARDLIHHGVNGYIMRDSTTGEIGRAIEWFACLAPSEVLPARRVSLELAKQFSPSRWSKSVEAILSRQAARI